VKYLFGNGRVFLGDSARSWSQAVGVCDGKIAAVGSESDVREEIGAGTVDIDLGGRFLIAGFQDAHVHPMMGGLARMRCNLEHVSDLGTALTVVADYVNGTDTGWVLGGGWNYHWFEGGNPAGALLDAITDRPVYLGGADGHSGWANSTALRLADISAATPDPEDGRIERLSDGSPQGTLHEGAMHLMERAVPQVDAATLRAALLEGQRYLLSLGITAWQDAWVTGPLHETYRELATSGDLKAAVRGCLWWDRERELDQLGELVVASREGVGAYDPRTIKLMLDGVCENHTAALLEPYLDQAGTETDNTGLDFIPTDDLAEIVTRIDAVGLQCHFHALGDRAVRNALDAIAAARRVNGWTDTRPHLAHLQLVDPADIPRFRQLGATANAQPLWAVLDGSMSDLTIPFIGPARTGHQYPWKSLLAAGATMAMGSDWSVSTPDVMAQIDIAVHRNDPARGIDKVFLSDQRIGLADALMAFTAGSAHVNHRDSVSGSIERGKQADLAVLNADPFALERPRDIGVDMTMIAGEVVFEGESV